MKPFVNPTPRVFISSTSEPIMLEYRKAASDSARSAGCLAVMHEDWVPEGRRTVDACLQRVDDCHALIVIVGSRYGYIPIDPANPEGRSITELEVRYALARKKPVYAFGLPLGEVPEGNAGVGLKRFRDDLQSGLFRTVDSPAQFKPKVSEVFADLRRRAIVTNVRGTAFVAACAVMVALGWPGDRPPAPVAPPLLSYVHGTVVTRQSQLPGRGEVRLECAPSITAALDGAGEFSLPLTDAPAECRALPVAIQGSTVDGRRFNGLLTDVSQNRVEVDDPPNRLAQRSRLGFRLHHISLQSAAPGGVSVFREFPLGVETTRDGLFVRSAKNEREGLVVSDGEPVVGSIVVLTVLTEPLSKVIDDVFRAMQADRRAGPLAMETFLEAAANAGTNPRTISETYRRMAAQYDGKSCASLREAVRLLRRAEEAFKSPQLTAQIIEMDAHRTLACLDT